MKGMYNITLPYDAIKSLLYAAITLAAPITTLTVSAPGANEVAFRVNHYFVTADATNGTIRLPSPSSLQGAGVDSGEQKGTVDVEFTNSIASTGDLKIQNTLAAQVARLTPGQSCRIRISSTTTVVISGGVSTGFLNVVAAINNSTPGLDATLAIVVPAGVGNTDIAPNVINRAYDIIGTKFVSSGASGGTVRVQTAGGALNVTDLMVPGNADIVTNETTLSNRAFAAGAGLRIVASLGNPGGVMYLRLLPR